MNNQTEQDIRISARNWCGPIDTDHGASENQVENIALHFFEEGFNSDEKELLQKIKNFPFYKFFRDYQYMGAPENGINIDKALVEELTKPSQRTELKEKGK